MSSLFSKIVRGEIPCHKVAENDHFLAFLDIRPLAKGHTLVIPKKEVDSIFDVEDADYQALFLFAKQVAKAIKAVVPCKKVGLSVVGLEVPHAHIHLIPINKISDMSFGTGHHVAMSASELAGLATQIGAQVWNT
jgi:histidine triad (HIT) family protein